MPLHLIILAMQSLLCFGPTRTGRIWYCDDVAGWPRGLLKIIV